MPMPSGSPWYRTGTVNVTNGSVNLVFTDTLLSLNCAQGDTFKGPDGKDYELEAPSDDTHVALKTPYLGATLAAQSYAIVRNFANVSLAAQVAAGLSALFTKYHTTMDQLVSWLTGSGTVTLSDGVGNTYNVQTPTALQAALHGRLSKNVAGSTATIALTSAEAANRQIVLTGARTAALTLTVPDGTTSDFYVDNQTTGGYDATIKTVSGTGQVVKPGKGMTPLAADGTNVIMPNVNTAGGLTVGNGAGALTAGTGTFQPATAATPITLGVLSNATAIPALSYNGAFASTTMAGTYSTAGNLYTMVPAGKSHFFGVADVTTVTLDSSGNSAFGGGTPAAWGASYKALQVGASGSLWSGASGELAAVMSNAYFDGANYKRLITGSSSFLSMSGGALQFGQAASGAPGSTITYTYPLNVDANGRWICGTGAAVGRATVYGENAGQPTLTVFNNAGAYNLFSANGNASLTYSGWSGANTGLWLAKDSGTNRSLNATGTLNASGADYAEYIRKAIIECLFAKGALLGFDADGKITDKWSAAVSGFGVKSTNPNLVGGDVWGASDQVGERPTEPTYTAPTYDGSADPGPAPVAPQFVLPAEPVRQDGESDETFAVFVAAWQRQCVDLEADFAAATEQHQQALASWQAAGAQYRIDQQAHAARVATAEAAHAALMDVYQQHKLAFEDRLEQARQSVDRIAFSGLVPVNVQGAQPGDYILAAEGTEDAIIGVVVTKAVMAANMTHYLDAVGRVRRVLPDGRAEVAVIVH